MLIATATDFQNNFGKYLQAVQAGDEVIILKNGKEAARLVATEKKAYLSDSLVGILKEDHDLNKIRAERLKKYETDD